MGRKRPASSSGIPGSSQADDEQHRNDREPGELRPASVDVDRELTAELDRGRLLSAVLPARRTPKRTVPTVDAPPRMQSAYIHVTSVTDSSYWHYIA